VKLQDDLRELLASFVAREVDFVVVGGHAVAYHGHPRYTGDIDLLIRPTTANAERVLDALATFGFPDLGLTPADLTTPETVIQLGRPPNRVDLMTSIEAVPFDEAWATREMIDMDEVPVAMIAKDLLLRNKRSVGRAKDVADIEELEER
jgi:predicted nucleotidyltransferase